MRIPQFSADRALIPHSTRYRGARYESGALGSHVVAQLRIGGGGFGATNSCDGCDTFSYVGCLMDCEKPGSAADCSAKCLARAFECDVCNGPFLQFGSSLIF